MKIIYADSLAQAQVIPRGFRQSFIMTRLATFTEAHEHLTDSSDADAAQPIGKDGEAWPADSVRLTGASGIRRKPSKIKTSAPCIGNLLLGSSSKNAQRLMDRSVSIGSFLDHPLRRAVPLWPSDSNGTKGLVGLDAGWQSPTPSAFGCAPQGRI